MKHEVKTFCLISWSISMLPFIGLANSGASLHTDSESVYYAISLNKYGIWEIADTTPHVDQTTAYLSSRSKGENKTGSIESLEFTITQPKMRLKVRGWDSKNGNAGKNRVELIDANNGHVLLKASPPQGDAPVWVEWNSKELIGKKVFTSNDL